MKSVQSRCCGVVSRGRRTLLFSFRHLAGLLCVAGVLPAGAATSPDLIVWADSVNPRIVERNYTTSSCEVVEGCALPGPRRYLIFNTETRNIGTADLVLGHPANNTNFVYAPCHGHYHFMDFADYRLVNSAGQLVAIGLKAGFCLLDAQRWDSSASLISKYDCNNQGIQRGWADIYTAFQGNSTNLLSCQWVDITGLEAGIYMLEIEVNPVGRLPELTRTNNIARLSVVIDAPCFGPPANDDFANAIVLSNRVESIFSSTRCATGEPNEPTMYPGTDSTNSIWFRWRAPYGGNAMMTTEGSTLNTVMAVYTGTTLSNLTRVAINNHPQNSDKRTSLVSFTAVSNTVYHIAVAGYGTDQGGVALNINPAGNDLFTNYLALPGSSGSIWGRNTTARREPGEPVVPGARGTNSVWFCGQVPSSGLLRFDTEGSNFDTLLAVYTGSRITNLVLVASDNDSGTNKTSRLYFQAEAGTNYWVAVDGVEGQSGFYRLNWGAPGPGPRFHSLRPLPSGGKEIEVWGLIGDRYRIETTGDFGTWTNWMRVTNLTGRLQFLDPVTNDNPRRFYRAVLVP
jgi:Lysyl oxidase